MICMIILPPVGRFECVPCRMESYQDGTAANTDVGQDHGGKSGDLAGKLRVLAWGLVRVYWLPWQERCKFSAALPGAARRA
jgi:hypothetical protein